MKTSKALGEGKAGVRKTRNCKCKQGWVGKVANAFKNPESLGKESCKESVYSFQQELMMGKLICQGSSWQLPLPFWGACQGVSIP